MDSRVTEILQAASPLQLKWLSARLVSKTNAEACQRIGVSRSTVYHWANKRDLDYVCHALWLEAAAATAFRLEQLALLATAALEAGLGESSQSLRAADLILSHVEHNAAHSSGWRVGPSEQPITIIEIAASEPARGDENGRQP